MNMEESDGIVELDAESVKLRDKKEYQRQYYLKNKERLLAAAKEYSARPEVRERGRKFDQTPEGKERIRRHNQKRWADPEFRKEQAAYHAEYQKRPEVRERLKRYKAKYMAKPGVKDRLSLKHDEYMAKPGIRGERLAYLAEYKSKPENKEKIIEFRKEYEKRSEVKERKRERRSTPESVASRAKRFREYMARPEARARRAAYLRSEAGRAAISRSWHKRRALKMGCESNVTTAEIAEMKRDALECCYCGALFSETLKKTIDHVIPLSKGGSNNKENLIICCGDCNSQKHAKPVDEWLKILDAKKNLALSADSSNNCGG